ncbi:hypothetical protein SDC9_107751 [bioreactor metagenome]|uniref:CinA C-terminal domain-containing protein n=1 Tax=bioreactor metagenome TaxID=1076179 RepID=A0A645B664_9ZZZZ
MEFQEGRLRETLHEVLVADGDQPLEALLGEALRSNNLTVSTAESCTGGSIAHRITLVPGASAYYKGSVVSYDNTVKTSILGVDNKAIEIYGAVSREVVEQMAQNVSEKLKTDCSIAVSGIAGPNGGTFEKPVGTVWICTRMHNEMVTQKYQFGTSREENINRTTNMAILQIIKMLGKYKKVF